MDTFKRDKTHQALFECGKRLAGSFTTLVWLLALSMTVTYSTAPGDEISVPLLSLKLDRITAAAALVVLVSFAFFRYCCLAQYLIMLRRQLSSYPAESERLEETWATEYPSLERLFDIYSDKSAIYQLVASIGYLVPLLGGIVLPLAALYHIGEQMSYSAVWWFVASGAAILLVLGLLIVGISMLEDARDAKGNTK